MNDAVKSLQSGTKALTNQAEHKVETIGSRLPKQHKANNLHCPRKQSANFYRTMISVLSAGNKAQHQRPKYDWLSSRSAFSSKSFDSILFPDQGSQRCTLVHPKLIDAARHTFPEVRNSRWLSSTPKVHSRKWGRRHQRATKISMNNHGDSPQTPTVSLGANICEHPKSHYRKRRFRLRLKGVATSGATIKSSKSRVFDA